MTQATPENPNDPDSGGNEPDVAERLAALEAEVRQLAADVQRIAQIQLETLELLRPAQTRPPEDPSSRTP